MKCAWNARRWQGEPPRPHKKPPITRKPQQFDNIRAHNHPPQTIRVTSRNPWPCIWGRNTRIRTFVIITVALLQASPEDSTCSASQTCVGCRCLEQVFFKDMISAQMLCRGKIFVEKISVMSKVWKLISENIPRDAIVTQLPRTQTGLELN